MFKRAQNVIDINGLINIHNLWQTDRAAAMVLLTDFRNQLDTATFNGQPKYKESELADYGLTHFIARMDRQNRMIDDNGVQQGHVKANGDGGPTTVWTAIVVRVENGKVMEGRISELYPAGNVLAAYDIAAPGKKDVSKEVAQQSTAEILSETNKTAYDAYQFGNPFAKIIGGEKIGVPKVAAFKKKVEVGYDGVEWRKTAAKKVGTFMDLDPSRPAPAGFQRVPITHHQPPTEEGKKDDPKLHTPLALYMQKDGPLDKDDLKNVETHLRSYYSVIYGDYKTDPVKAVNDDMYLRQSISQLNDPKFLNDEKLRISGGIPPAPTPASRPWAGAPSRM